MPHTAGPFGSGPFASVLPPAQLEVLASLPGALSDGSYHVYTTFFGLDILCLAYLVLQSRFAPRAIGVLLAIDGLAYPVYSFADLLVPGFASHLVPWIQLPAPIAEAAFSVWLLVFGVNTTWWTTRAGAAVYSASSSFSSIRRSC